MRVLTSTHHLVICGWLEVETLNFIQRRLCANFETIGFFNLPFNSSQKLNQYVKTYNSWKLQIQNFTETKAMVYNTARGLKRRYVTRSMFYEYHAICQYIDQFNFLPRPT